MTASAEFKQFPVLDQVSDLHRSKFLKSFKALKESFDKIQRSAQIREQTLMQDQALIAKQLEQLVINAQDKLVDGHPISHLCRKWLEDTRSMNDQWLQAAQRFDRGTSLNDSCHGSFVTYVYGKVNSGKSSLGNFTSVGKCIPSEKDIKEQELCGLRFFLHDKTDVETRKKQTLKQGFAVDHQECTSSVQYFTLPGLTWVDVPGLHSKNAINGKLAQEYLQSADLVVYVMNAEHPARESDLAEIGSLLEMDKPIVFVITCSDEIEHDEVDGELIQQRKMYSSADREAQNQYFLERLKQHFNDHPGIKKVHAISVSALYAEEAGNDNERMEESGIPEFMRMMQQLIENDSVQIKKQTPEKNLAHFARQLLKASHLLAQKHSQIRTELQKLEDDVESQYQAMVGQLTLQLNSMIARTMQNYDGDNELFGREVSKSLEQASSELLQAKLSDQLSQLEGAVANVLSFDCSDDLPGFKYEYESFNYNDKGKKRAWGSASGGAVGGITGGVIAGPVGALIGSFVGGLVGEFAGRALAKDHSRQVIVGDNRFQVEEAAYQLFSERIQQQLEQNYREPMLNVIGQIMGTLQQFESKLEGFCARTQSYCVSSSVDNQG